MKLELESMLMMETVKDIRISSKDQICYIKDSSSFHMNLTGLNIPASEKEKLYVKISNVRVPTVEKNISFSMYFGIDTKFLSNELVKECDVVYTSFDDLCMKINAFVYNSFIFDSHCLQSDSNSENPTNPHENTPAETSPEPYSSLTPSVILNVREQMGGSSIDSLKAKSLFALSYKNGKFSLEIAPKFMFFSSCNLMKLIGFETEINEALLVNSRSNVDAMKECEFAFMKICKPFTVSNEKEFLLPKEQICYITSRNLVAPTFFQNGCNYCVLGSFDMVHKKMTCFPKRLASNRLCELSFTMLNCQMEPYFFGVNLKKSPFSFDINILKPF